MRTVNTTRDRYNHRKMFQHLNLKNDCQHTFFGIITFFYYWYVTQAKEIKKRKKGDWLLM